MHDLWDFQALPPIDSSESESVDDDGGGIEKLTALEAQHQIENAIKSAVASSEKSPDVAALAEKEIEQGNLSGEDEFQVIQAPKRRLVHLPSYDVQKMMKYRIDILRNLEVRQTDDTDVQVEAQAEASKEFQQMKESLRPVFTQQEMGCAELNFKLEESPKSPEAEKVEFNVCLPNETRHTFRMLKTDPMSKVIDIMREKIPNVGFTMEFDGDLITDAMTPKSLEMEDGDKINLQYK